MSLTVFVWRDDRAIWKTPRVASRFRVAPLTWIVFSGDVRKLHMGTIVDVDAGTLEHKSV